jgi:hypothetical protein
MAFTCASQAPALCARTTANYAPAGSCVLSVQGCKVLVDDEAGVAVPTTVRNHFLQLRVLTKLGGSRMVLQPMASKWLEKASISKSETQ